MSTLRIEYDMYRSGFMFMVGGFTPGRPDASFAGTSIYRSESGRFAALESWRKLPLRKIHWSEFHHKAPLEDPVPPRDRRPFTNPARVAIRQRNEAYEQFIASRPSGDFPVEGAQFRKGPFHLRQTPKELSVWFSHGDDVPRSHWIREDDSNVGLTLWFSPRAVPQRRMEVEQGCQPCRLLAGMQVAFAFAETTYPIRRVILTPMDFKG